MITKKILITTILLSSYFIKAQWNGSPENSAFQDTFRGIFNFKVIDQNVLWGMAYDAKHHYKIAEATYTQDGGLTWTPTKIPVTAGHDYELSNITAVNKDTAWASVFYNNSTYTSEQGIYKTVNAGLLWTKVTSTEFTDPNSFVDFVHFFDSKNGIAVGDPIGGYFEIYTTINGGATWVRVVNANNQLTSQTSEYGVTKYSFSAVNNTLWFTTTQGRVFKTTDKGYTWTNSNAGTATDGLIVFRDASHGLLSYYDAINTPNKWKLKNTSDGGLTWSAPLIHTGFLVGNAVITAVPGTSAYVAGGDGNGPGQRGSSLTRDDGLTWELLEDTTQAIWQYRPQRSGIAFANATTGWSGNFNGLWWTNNIYQPNDPKTLNPAWGGIFKWTGGSVLNVALTLNTNELNGSSPNGISFFPNPTDGVLNIANIKDNTLVTVFNIYGEKVMEKNIPTISGTLDFVDFAKGVYFINIYNKENIVTKKIVVQ